MKRLLILSIIFSFSQLYAQINLVKNPSFENYLYCPHVEQMVCDANYWSGIVDTTYIADSQLVFNGIMGTINHFDAVCIPYYLNTCNDYTLYASGGATVPLGDFWNHYPRTGNGMMFVEMYVDLGTGYSYRYYLQGRLSQTLTAGQAYCVSFYVVNTHFSGNGCNHIGAYFDDGSIDTTTECGYVHTQYTPQVYTDSIITDTTNWTKIEGSFVANGTEKFITIGNFFDNGNTSLLPSNAHGAALHAFYLVDDVSVTATSAVANAGPDKVIPPGGDSVLIGTGTGYLPCYWYANGVLIDSNVAGIKVKPLTTTHYVIELNICGHSYDTVVVYVWKAGVNEPAPVTALQLYP